MEPTLDVVDDEHAMATWGRYVILVWRGTPTRPRLERQFELIRRHAAIVGARLGVFAVMEEGSHPPSPADLAFVGEGLDEPAAHVAAMVGAFEARGPHIEALRDSAERLAAHVAPYFAVRACFDVDEACTWITRRMTPYVDDRRELAVAVEKVRRAIPAPRG